MTSDEIRQQICAVIWANPHLYENANRLVQLVRQAVQPWATMIFDTNGIRYKLCLHEVVVEKNTKPNAFDKEWTSYNECRICADTYELSPDKEQFGICCIKLRTQFPQILCLEVGRTEN